MRGVSCNGYYRHVVKFSTPQFRGRSLYFSRTVKTTATGRSDSHPEYISSQFPDNRIPPPNKHAREIAVLGGGLTGLTTAFKLSQELPDAKITLFEKSNRLGGWVDSEVVKVDDGEVLFEWGPRTLRVARTSSAFATLELIGDLSLDHELITIPKTAPAARNRFIFYPDRLVKLPTPFSGSSISEILQSLSTLLTDPLFAGIWNLPKELSVPARPRGVQDESVGDFISRRFGKDLADNIASAVFHGIYAGDIYRLSAKTVMPWLWYLETVDRNEPSILLRVLFDLLHGIQRLPVTEVDHRFRSTVSHHTIPSPLPPIKRMPNGAVFKKISVYTFRRGVGQLTSALEERLRKDKNITIVKSTPVTGLTYNERSRKLSISCRRAQKPQDIRKQFDYAVSTLSLMQMLRLLPPNYSDHLASPKHEDIVAACTRSNALVNVMVVNLFYRNPELLPPSIRGFGYLIPRSVPVDQNPERALGVIFGSETARGVHTQRDPSRPPLNPNNLAKGHAPDVITQDTARGTKLTVMMGGHWWHDWAESDLPNEMQAIEMAQTVLKRHLNIEEQPAVAKARLNRDCIPQYPVGYSQDREVMDHALLRVYSGRVKCAGPWWTGSPGMNDCVSSAFEAAWAIRDGLDNMTRCNNPQWIVARKGSDMRAERHTPE